ncbi:hypothetical protein ACE3MZ_14175 [Paenibacillus sp. WLX1005]|uniref:hypothetical protein n=1 Tax=unclassified Paenibacillus TaxID=185978 RepID=UPI0039841350
MDAYFLQELHLINHNDEWRYKLMMQGIRRTLALRKAEGSFKRHLRRKKKYTVGSWH